MIKIFILEQNGHAFKSNYSMYSGQSIHFDYYLIYLNIKISKNHLIWIFILIYPDHIILFYTRILS